MANERYADIYKRSKESERFIDKYSANIPFLKERKRKHLLQRILYYMTSDLMEGLIKDTDEKHTIMLTEGHLPLKIAYFKDNRPIEFSWNEVDEGSVRINVVESIGLKIVTKKITRTNVRLNESKGMVFKAEYDVSDEDGAVQSEYLLSQQMQPLDTETTLQLIEVVSSTKSG